MKPKVTDNERRTMGALEPPKPVAALQALLRTQGVDIRH